MLGDPAGDVAYCYAELRYLGLDEAAERFAAAYREATGSELASLPYWNVTALCRAVPELHTYVDGWNALGHREDLEVVRLHLDRMIDEVLSG